MDRRYSDSLDDLFAAIGKIPEPKTLILSCDGGNVVTLTVPGFSDADWSMFLVFVRVAWEHGGEQALMVRHQRHGATTVYGAVLMRGKWMALTGAELRQACTTLGGQQNVADDSTVAFWDFPWKKRDR
jgi:hypothetical protein